MQATTSGVIHKVDVYDQKVIKSFLDREKAHFLKFKNKNALYQNKTLITTSGLNYLNLLPDSKIDLTLKNLILTNYYECENYYPYLGDVFLEQFFNQKLYKKTLNRFEKKDQKKFLNSLKDNHVKSLVKWIFDYINLERTINIQYYEGKNISVEIENDFAFQFSYDYDFYNNLANLTHKNYKFVIIDGYIESVGEVHHLFIKASQEKIPYVIFCYGMSEEVKHNIMVNNKKGSFAVLPVSLDVNDENTLNILNDIAVIHNSTIVSSNMGQTISQEVRKELDIGNKITFLKNKIYIDPVANNESLSKHKAFLLKRLNDAMVKKDVNVEPIKNRIKNFSVKKLNVYLPKELESKNSFQRELSYSLMFLKNIDKKYKILTYNEREYYIPMLFLEKTTKKSKSLKRIIDNIKIILS